MGKRGKQNWSRAFLPIGTIKQRRRRRRSGSGYCDVRFIKVRASGPKGRRWIPLAKFTWEQTHGPVPRGMRVVHADGNTLNDNPANYRLMTAGEVICLWHRLDFQMSDENRRGRKRREAIAAHNRLRGQVRRATGFIHWSWYAVDRQRGIVVDHPERSRRRLLSHFGVQVAINGAISRRRLAAIPFEIVRGRELERLDARFERKPLAEVTGPTH